MMVTARGRATETINETSPRLLRSHPFVGHADRSWTAVHGHVSRLAAGDRPCAWRAGVASATHDLVLSDWLCRCAGVSRSAVGSPRPAAGADRHARPLSDRLASLRAGLLHRDADCGPVH